MLPGVQAPLGLSSLYLEMLRVPDPSAKCGCFSLDFTAVISHIRSVSLEPFLMDEAVAQKPLSPVGQTLALGNLCSELGQGLIAPRSQSSFPGKAAVSVFVLNKHLVLL